MTTGASPMPRRLRFAILSSCPEVWGGSEELWFEAACALRGDGHRVDVFKTWVDRGHPRVRELEALGCPVTDLSGPGPVWRAARSPLRRRLVWLVMPAHLARVVPRLRLKRPDLAIVSQGTNFDGVQLARLCERLGIPYVLVSQKASPLHWPTDNLRDFIRGIHERAERTVFVSRHNARLTGEQLDSDLDNAIVLHNPVLAGAQGPLRWPDDAGPTRLACVGRLWVQEKGQDLLLELFGRPRWRDRDVTLSLYGQGANREGLEGLARRLRLDNVSFHGHVNDVESIWKTHHALLLASRTEGLPLVVQEAMACGRPPIVTDAGGVTELVDDGVTGFVADSASVPAIDAALERAWSRRQHWQEVGWRAADRIDVVRRERGPAPLAALALELATTKRRSHPAHARLGSPTPSPADYRGAP